MTAADMAASMIREGVHPHRAMSMASKKLCEPYDSIAKELARRSARNRTEAVQARERAAIKLMNEEQERQWKRAEKYLPEDY